MLNYINKVIDSKNKTFLILKFLVIIICSYGCKNENSEIAFRKENPNQNNLSFNAFPENKFIQFNEVFEFKERGMPLDLHVQDSTIIIFNAGGNRENFFYNYSLKNKKLSDGYLSRGNGPHEVISAVSFGVDNGLLWLYDFTSKSILTIDIADALKTNVSKSIRKYTNQKFFSQIRFSDSLHYFGVGSYDSYKKIQKVDLLSNEILNELGDFKVPEDKNFYSHKAGHSSHLFIKPTNEKLVLANYYSDEIEVFDNKNKLSKKIIGPEGFNTEYDVIPTGNKTTMGPNKKTRYAFTGGAVTDQYIYLVYSGKSFHDKFGYLGNSIYVYDWQGNPIKKIMFESERGIVGLAVSEDNNTVYSYDFYSGFIIKANILE